MVAKYITKTEVLNSLRSQGFQYKDGHLIFTNPTKDRLRNLNSTARNHLILKNRILIEKNENRIINDFMANGSEITPLDISPQLTEVKTEEQATLFRWVKLHWSIPISAGYGRRLRYLVMDKNNDRLIGVIGLADPVYALKDRDSYIGWSESKKSKNLKCLLDGFIIGSVPPYSFVLGGKLVASLVTSKKVYNDFRRKYFNTKALISGNIFKKNIAAITTTSAYGKSSMYDRISIPNGTEYLHVGWTKGSGEFQFLNGTYEKLHTLTNTINMPFAKNARWGSGIRNRRTVVLGALEELGLPKDLLYHGIKREVFIAPFGENWREYLLGKNKRLKLFKRNEVKDIADYMLNRWVVPRSERDKSYLTFKNKKYSLSLGTS
jgi:hypothetical protein